MKNNTKALVLTLLATTIIATGASFASNNTTWTWVIKTFKEMTWITTEQKAQMEAIKIILQKQKSWSGLTTQEQSTLDTFKSTKMQKMWWKGQWKWKHNWMMKWFDWMWKWMMNNSFGGKIFDDMSDSEKTQFESMTYTEKKAFFEKKRIENEQKNDAREAVIDKLLLWTALTDADKVIVEEIKLQRAWEKIKKAEREQMKVLMDKVNTWITLTADEQIKFDAFQAKMPEKKWRWFDRD